MSESLDVLWNCKTITGDDYYVTYKFSVLGGLPHFPYRGEKRDIFSVGRAAALSLPLNKNDSFSANRRTSHRQP